MVFSTFWGAGSYLSPMGQILKSPYVIERKISLKKFTERNVFESRSLKCIAINRIKNFKWQKVKGGGAKYFSVIILIRVDKEIFRRVIVSRLTQIFKILYHTILIFPTF